MCPKYCFIVPQTNLGSNDALRRFGDKDGIGALQFFYARCDFRSRSSIVLTGLNVSRGTSIKTVFQNAIDPFHSPGNSSALSSQSSYGFFEIKTSSMLTYEFRLNFSPL